MEAQSDFLASQCPLHVRLLLPYWSIAVGTENAAKSLFNFSRNKLMVLDIRYLDIPLDNSTQLSSWFSPQLL